MSKNKFHLSMSSIIWVIATFVVAVLGLIAGNWFIGWRQADADQLLSGENIPVITTLFEKGKMFPDIPVLNINGIETTITEIFGHQNTVLLFMAPGCDACVDVINNWKQYVDDMDFECKLIGISVGDYEFAKSYFRENEFPYPVYFDTAHRFAAEYEVYQYPNVMGLDYTGRIAFLNRGIYGQFSPLDACDLIDKLNDK